MSMGLNEHEASNASIITTSKITSMVHNSCTIITTSCITNHVTIIEYVLLSLGFIVLLLLISWLLLVRF